MADYELHQSHPGFHGRHVFLDFFASHGMSAVAYIRPHRGSHNTVAIIYLPDSKHSALARACDAFNAIMDECYEPPLPEPQDEEEIAF